MTVFNYLGVCDILGGLLLLWAMQTITSAAGFRTSQARWALMRRLVYCDLAIALEGLGVERFLSHEYRNLNVIVLFQVMLLVGILIFPVMRALGLISQDFFISGNNVAAKDRERCRSLWQS